MTRSRYLSTPSRRPSDGVSGAWWFARWLLVLVVACDLLSAPFHRHHHDGVEQLGFAAAHASLDDADSHAESADQPLASHSAMAIRIDTSRLGQLPAIDNIDAQVALVFAAKRLAAVDEVPPERWRPDRTTPDFRSHRSLPPAGRAPPLHA